MQNLYLHRNMNEKTNYGFVKTKPFEPNNQSSTCAIGTCAIGIITNHLGGKPKQSQFKFVLDECFLAFLSGTQFWA